MYHSVDIIFCEYFCNSFFITDICFYKCIVISAFNICKIFKVTCIGKLIYVDYSDIITILIKHIVNII
jgi:hypothetical protein